MTIGFPVVGGIIAAALLALIAPAIVSFLLVDDPAQFSAQGRGWWFFLAAAPIVALVLVARRGLVPRRGRRPRSRSLTTRQRWAALRRSLLCAGILLSVTNITALILLLTGNVVHGPYAARHAAVLFGGSAAAVAVVLIAIRVWDRWFPPGQKLKPVTVKAVQEAAAEAEKTLRQVQANNQRVDALAAAVERQLHAARLAVGFAHLCELHYESRTCADSMYRHYGHRSP